VVDLSRSLRHFVEALLPSGYPDIHRVAESVGLSVRTLQRRLGADGLTYGRLVAETRFALARRRMADPRRKLIDVALDLGYSDPAHFTRAFRSWTGTTPRTFRRLLGDGAVPAGLPPQRVAPDRQTVQD
jgi:AraC-like DNA-binding protein